MTEELKRKLLDRILWPEHMAEETTYDPSDHSSEFHTPFFEADCPSDKAYSMIEVLGLGSENAVLSANGQKGKRYGKE